MATINNAIYSGQTNGQTYYRALPDEGPSAAGGTLTRIDPSQYATLSASADPISKAEFARAGQSSGLYSGPKTANNAAGFYSNDPSVPDPMASNPAYKNIGTGDAPAYVPVGSAADLNSQGKPFADQAKSITAQMPGVTAVNPNVKPVTPPGVGSVNGPYIPTPEQTAAALAAAKASGAAPQDSSAGSARVQAALNQTAPASTAPNPVQQAQSQLEQSPEYQQFLADQKVLQAQQSQSQVDFIQKEMDAFGVTGINTQLLNNQKIIDGTEQDIRNEVQAAGGFATNSQVLALASARNKSLIEQDKILTQQKTDALAMVDRLSSAFANDQQTARQAMMDKLNLDEKALDLRDKFISANQEAAKNIIQATGYAGYVNSLLNIDPSGASLRSAEQLLGFQPGQLQQVANKEQADRNLKLIQDSGATSPYVVTANGEVWNTQTGYAYTSPQDFQQKTGQPLQNAIATNQIQKLPMNVEGQIKQAQLTKAQSDAKYADTQNQLDIQAKQANINQSNAAIAKSNAETAQLKSGVKANQDAITDIQNLQQHLKDSGAIQGNGTISSSDYKIGKQKFVNTHPDGFTDANGQKISANDYYDQQMFSYVDTNQNTSNKPGYYKDAYGIGQ
jgi:hypothetical protein